MVRFPGQGAGFSSLKVADAFRDARDADAMVLSAWQGREDAKAAVAANPEHTDLEAVAVAGKEISARMAEADDADTALLHLIHEELRERPPRRTSRSVFFRPSEG